MELRIRSQDKERLVKVEYLEYFYKKVHYANEEKPREEHHNIGTYISNEQFIILGEYKTKERALEVLNLIQNFIENNYQTCLQQHDNGSFSVVPVYLSRKTVFEMPKE